MPVGSLLELVGKTPVVRLRPRRGQARDHLEFFAKLEFYNPTGSIKDRPAAYIVRKLLVNREIDRDTVLIESSSGNFGVALAAVCRAAGIRFTCVVDPLILNSNAYLLRQLRASVVQVTSRDESGGYLKARLKAVEDLTKEIPNSVWVNQYANPYNAESHYFGTGLEIYETFRDTGLDYVFVPVSSGGTITGVSRILKEQFRDVKVIAVDTAGSVIFGDPPRKRFIPGMGSSIVPALLRDAIIDDVFHVKEEDMVRGCFELLRDHALFLGGSSGAVYFAATEYFRYTGSGASSQVSDELRAEPGGKTLKILMTFADRGERYASTVYNPEWTKRTFPREAW